MTKFTSRSENKNQLMLLVKIGIQGFQVHVWCRYCDSELEFQDTILNTKILENELSAEIDSQSITAKEIMHVVLGISHQMPPSAQYNELL